MAEGISFEWVTEPFTRAMEEIALNTERATMYALRETGRKITSTARAAAPAYKGPQNKSPGIDARAQAESGQLRSSIKNGRNIKNDGGTYELAVGPFGAVTRSGGSARGVQLYRGEVESMYGYMGRAFSHGDLPGTYEAALAEAWSKYR